MLKFFKSLVRPVAPGPVEEAARAEPPPRRVVAPGVEPFELASAWVDANGFPVLDWTAVQVWVTGITDPTAQAQAWAACERAWLAHLAVALGPGSRVQARGSVLLLSSLAGHVANATLAFVDKTVQRILRTLDGVARAPEWGQDILIVFDDDEAYYRYVAHYYPQAGEFAGSSGMYINHGCGHFVTVKADLHAVEPVIAHELTHACLSHLPIPAWLNEGLAVNTELRLTPRPVLQDPRRLRERHLAFWGPQEIQQFWSGKSFLRNDEGNELSYDLARNLVAQFAADWPRFRDFALAAHLEDGGAGAALAQLHVDLGAAACAMLAREPDPRWAPLPLQWQETPERGAF